MWHWPSNQEGSATELDMPQKQTKILANGEFPAIHSNYSLIMSISQSATLIKAESHPSVAVIRIH